MQMVRHLNCKAYLDQGPLPCRQSCLHMVFRWSWYHAMDSIFRAQKMATKCRKRLFHVQYEYSCVQSARCRSTVERLHHALLSVTISKELNPRNMFTS